MTKKTILITGGAGFLGSRYSCELSKFYNVIALDISLKKLSKLKKKNKNIRTYSLDITDEKQITNFANSLFKKKISIYGLINNACIDSIPNNNTGDSNQYINLKNWDNELNVGLKGAALMIKVFGKKMIKSKKGRIINIGSDLSVNAPNQKIYKNSFKNFKKSITYSIIKHALLGLTKYYSALFAEYNICVNMLSPGPIKNKHKKTFVNDLSNIIPMNRMGKTNDLIQPVLFLLDEKNSYMTGQNLIIDGGKTII